MKPIQTNYRNYWFERLFSLTRSLTHSLRFFLYCTYESKYIAIYDTFVCPLVLYFMNLSYISNFIYSPSISCTQVSLSNLFAINFDNSQIWQASRLSSYNLPFHNFSLKAAKKNCLLNRHSSLSLNTYIHMYVQFLSPNMTATPPLAVVKPHNVSSIKRIANCQQHFDKHRYAVPMEIAVRAQAENQNSNSSYAYPYIWK